MLAIRPYALHWFRRDLRVAGNEALARRARAHAGRVRGIFGFDEAEEALPDEPRRPIAVHDVQRAKALALYRRSSPPSRGA